MIDKLLEILVALVIPTIGVLALFVIVVLGCVFLTGDPTRDKD